MGSRGRNKRVMLQEDLFASLPSDVLHLILSGLDLRDHVRLGATCKSMQHFAMQLHLPSSKPFWLVVIDSDPTELIDGFLSNWPSKYSLRHRYYHRHAASRCVGFYQGWLMIERFYDRSRALHVCNRVLGSQIQLPPWKELYGIRKVVLSSEPGSDGCMAAVMHGNRKVSICRLGFNRSWVALDCKEEEGDAMDVVFVRDNLQVLFSNGFHTVDMNEDPPMLKRLHLTKPMHSGCRYLIKIKERLLLLALHVCPVGRTGDILNIDLQELRTRDSIRIEDLGGGAILVCLGHAAYVPSRELGPLRGGCMYFMDGGYRHIQRFGDQAKNIDDEEEHKAWNLPFFRMFCIDN